MVTPFEPESGNVDFAGLRQLLQYHVEAGTDNLCILGTTGEAGVLSMAEREQVLQVAVEQVKGKLPIMVGCGTINPASVKAMVQQAVDCGCDAALIVTPYYVKPPQRCLVKHFLDAATYGLPVVVYNVPSRTAVDMTDESIALCASLHENIVAVKDATGKLARVAALREQLAVVAAANAAGALPNKDFLLYSGDDATSMDFVLQGGDGCISVTANVAANAMHRVMASALRGDGPSAAALNDPLRLLHEKLFCEANPIPVKYAVSRMMGGSDGSMKNNKVLSAYCRPPLDYLDASYESAVESALRQAGLLAEE